MKELGVLRKMSRGDLEQILEWRNAPSVAEKMYTRHKISLEEHREWWEKTRGDKRCQYFIYESYGFAKGVVSFTDINISNRNCFWAFYADPDAAKGTGSCMEFLALDHAFRELCLEKISCEVLAFNKPVIGLHQKFGFVVEGVFRGHHFWDGEFVDIWRLGLMRSEWDCSRENILNDLLEKRVKSK